MIFGATDHFAIEAVLEPGPEYSSLPGHPVGGRIRVWFCGVSVGNFDEPLCWLDAPRRHLMERLDDLERLWDPAFAGLTPERIFARLDEANYGVPDRFASPTDAPIDSEEDFWRFDFLFTSSEAFDGWKAFLLRPSPSKLLALVLAHETSEFHAFEFTTQAYSNAVSEFDHWLTVQEQRLLNIQGSARRRPTHALRWSAS